MNTLIAIAGILIAAALQARMPTLWWLGGMRIEFLPALVAYMAMTMRRPRVLLLALAAGMMQDALSATPFGISALAYGVAAWLMTNLRETFDRDLPWIQMGMGMLTSAAASILACLVIGISVGVLFKIAILAAISGVITVFLFFALDYARMAWGHA